MENKNNQLSSNKIELDGFRRIMNEMYGLKESKSGDYANSWRVLGLQGLYYQIARKFTRLWINKDKTGIKLNHEMLRDTLIDLAVYSIMSIQLIDEGDIEDKLDKILKDYKPMLTRGEIAYHEVDKDLEKLN